MTIVDVRARDAAGRPLTGVEVVVRLVAGQRPSDPGHLANGDGTVVEVARRRTNAAGHVELELVPNVEIEPRDDTDPDAVEALTYYDVTVGAARRAIVVPPAGRFDWSDPAIAVVVPVPPDWVPPGGSRTLAGLTDVDVDTAEVGEVLGRDADGVWRGRPVSTGPGGTTDHRLLEHRDAPDAHPVAAITGLEDQLAGLVADDDPRLVDARTPTAHAAQHAAGGTDPIAVDQAQVDGLVAALAALDAAIDDEVAARAAAIIAEAGARDAAIAAAITDLVDGAPTALDTLRELAEELADQDDALQAVLTALDGKVATTSPRLAPDPTAAADGMLQVTESGLWVARTAAQVRSVLGLAGVATSGAYGDLSGRPTLGTAAAEDVEAFDPAGAAAAVSTIGVTGGIEAWAATADDGARYFDVDTSTEYVAVDGEAVVANAPSELWLVSPTAIADVGDIAVFGTKAVPELTSPVLVWDGRPIRVDLGQMGLTMASGTNTHLGGKVLVSVNGGAAVERAVTNAVAGATATSAVLPATSVVWPRPGFDSPTVGQTVQFSVSLSSLGGNTGVKIGMPAGGATGPQLRIVVG